MKVLVLQQPWAQLVVSGVVDTANLDFDTDYRGNVLIYAASEPMTEDFFNDIPVEWAKTISNEQAFDNIGINQELPLNALVGYVQLTDVTEGKSDDFWADNNRNFHWHFQQAELFDSPQQIVVPQDIFADCEVNEKAMPTHEKAVLTYPTLEGSQLVVPVSESGFWDLSEVEDYSFYVDKYADYTTSAFGNVSDLEQAPIKSILFRHHDFTILRTVKQIAYCAEKGEDGADVTGPSIQGGEAIYDYALFVLKGKFES